MADQVKKINEDDYEMLCVIPYIIFKDKEDIKVKGILRSSFLKALQSFCEQNQISYFMKFFKSEKIVENRLVFYCEKNSLALFEKENEILLKDGGIDLKIIN